MYRTPSNPWEVGRLIPTSLPNKSLELVEDGDLRTGRRMVYMSGTEVGELHPGRSTERNQLPYIVSLYHDQGADPGFSGTLKKKRETLGTRLLR